MNPEELRFVSCVCFPRNQATVQDVRVVVQNVQGRQNKVQGYCWFIMGELEQSGNANPGQPRQVKCYNCNGLWPHARNCNRPKRNTELELLKTKMLLMQAQENRVALDEEQLLFLAADDEMLVISDVDETPMATKLCSWLILSLQILIAVYDHHEEHEMHDDVQPNYVVDSHANYTSNRNMIPYDQYVKDNAIQARFELTEREQNINEQLRIFITDRNIKEENLKKELHSVKLQLASTINHNKLMVAIGYKNPLYLTRAKQAQPALYNGYEIIKNNQVPAIVQNTEDTLEIAEITRRKMHYKMKDPECVTHKVKIAPPDYSKENYLATFTPQKQLTPEQIFWSQDIIKMKAEALKVQTTASRPTKVLTIYPPNTPAMLVPRVLPTKSQVKINIFALIQLFSDFEKTCNKRITPTGLTEGERGFEQTKACYLTEVIPFFKTLKEHFEGIQKALTKEVKEMKEIFEELEAEVDQHVVDRKHDEIERKNLLIANDNLIADCLFKDVFHVATNSELNVSSFTEMHDAHTSLKARCLELEVELSNLRDKIQKDNHDELIKRFSNLEVNHLNLQLKYQNLKESFGNDTSPPTRDVPDFDSVFVIEKMKASIQGKDNAIKKLRMQISQLNETRSEADRTLDFRTLDFQITQLTEKINVLQEQNELFGAENGKIKQHYKELYDSIKITM
ncbi:hypothetical protein Tco_0955636 [Tanacetum coccineum]|uniref:Uncharacterized protein n=1 Tax=Tanacetum coccineum TaxID=301880 RepID=A0ABQ5E7R6_9ASTR